MSETRIVHCDRCGLVVDSGLVRLRVETGRSGGETIDLHADCYAAFRSWLAAKEKA